MKRVITVNLETGDIETESLEVHPTGCVEKLAKTLQDGAKIKDKGKKSHGATTVKSSPVVATGKLKG